MFTASRKFQRDSTEIVFQCFNVLCVFKKKKKKMVKNFKHTNYYTISRLRGKKIESSNEKASQNLLYKLTSRCLQVNMLTFT